MVSRTLTRKFDSRYHALTMAQPGGASPIRAGARWCARFPLSLAAASLLFAGGLPATAAPEAETIAADAATAARLDAHRQAFASLDSVQVDVRTRTHLPAGRTIGRVVLQGARAYYRVTEVDEAGERVAQESVVTATEQWSLNFVAGVATRVDMERVRAADRHVVIPNSATDTLNVFAGAAPGSVQFLGPTMRDEQMLDRFRMTAGIGGGPPGELVVWVGPDDGVPRRLELRSPAGRLLLERDFVNVKVNAPIPDALFVPQVPADMPVHDLTDEYLAGPAD